MVISNAVNHFKTITRHRHLVMLNCFKAGIPLQGLMHDLSKYTPQEFLTGVRYFNGTHSPNVEERAEKGYSSAWMHHKGRNKHHYEYWFDNDDATLTLQPVEMPIKYVAEMFCDRIAASKIYKGDAYRDSTSLEYFDSHDYRVSMNKNTRTLLRSLLVMLSEEGEKKTFAYVRKLVYRDKLNRLKKSLSRHFGK